MDDVKNTQKYKTEKLCEKDESQSNNVWIYYTHTYMKKTHTFDSNSVNRKETYTTATETTTLILTLKHSQMLLCSLAQMCFVLKEWRKKNRQDKITGRIIKSRSKQKARYGCFSSFVNIKTPAIMCFFLYLMQVASVLCVCVCRTV